MPWRPDIRQLQSIFERSMPLAQAGVGTGSRKENAKKKESSIFERSMSLAQAGMEPVRVKKML